MSGADIAAVIRQQRQVIRPVSPHLRTDLRVLMREAREAGDFPQEWIDAVVARVRYEDQSKLDELERHRDVLMRVVAHQLEG